MEIFVTRFNNTTFQENKNWLKKNNIIGCIYGSPIKISETCLPETEIIVIEMNNSKNKVSLNLRLLVSYFYFTLLSLMLSKF